MPFVDIENYLLPEGIGWRNHIDKISKRYNYKILSTQDSCWLYLFYHFVFFIGLYSVFILFKNLSKFIIQTITHFSINAIERFYVLLAFLIGFFYTRSIFYDSSKCCSWWNNADTIIYILSQSNINRAISKIKK